MNIRRARHLLAQGNMQPTGRRAFEARRENTSGKDLYDHGSSGLVQPYRRMLKRKAGAWAFFEAQPPSYRDVVSWWIISAKKEETRVRRLEKLAAFSARQQRLPELARKRPATRRRGR